MRSRLAAASTRATEAMPAGISKARRAEVRGFDPSTSFGDAVSRRYDAEETRGDEDDTVRFLAELAAGRDALEFAVGTGRIALPLSETGGRVDGIELSADMVARMREKPGGDRLEVIAGDMSEVET